MKQENKKFTGLDSYVYGLGASLAVGLMVWCIGYNAIAMANHTTREHQTICLKLYLENGRQTEGKFSVPDGYSDLKVVASCGTYNLCYYDNEFMFTQTTVVLKAGVIDFEQLNCEQTK